MRPSSNLSTTDRDKLPTCGRVFIRQVHERVVLLGLAESYTDVVFPQCVLALTGLGRLVDKVSNFLVGGVHGI